MRHLKDLPGPRKSLLLGNLTQIRPAQVHRDFEQWAETFGAEFVVWFHKTPVLVLSRHEAISKILRERPDTFQRPPRTSAAGREMGLKPGVFSAEGDTWRHQRRMVMSSFSPGQVRAYFPSMLKVTKRLRNRWMRACETGAVIELQDDLMRYTVDTITGLAFGSDVNTLEAGDDIIQQHLNTIFPAMSRRTFAVFPYWRYFKLAADRELDKGVQVVNEAIDKFVREARERLAADPARRASPPNLLESFIVSAGQEDGKITDKDIAGNVLTMLLAGEDTTANSMAWMLDLLQRNPVCLEKVQAEVRRVMQDQDEFTPELLAGMEYLEACVHETMRLKPVAPFLPVQALKETMVGDVLVPAGTLVWNILRHDAVSDTYFEKAAQFRPERWLGEASGGKSIAMPFGSGPRMCPGRYLALLEIKLCMSMLLNHFEILEVRPVGGGETGERMNFTMTPEDLRMKLAPRKARAELTAPVVPG